MQLEPIINLFFSLGTRKMVIFYLSTLFVSESQKVVLIDAKEVGIRHTVCEDEAFVHRSRIIRIVNVDAASG